MKSDNKGSLFTPKNVLRLLAICCMIFFFCPAFLVSCSGHSISITASDLAIGRTYYGEQIFEGHPVAFIAILIPIAILVLLFIKKFSDIKNATIIAVAGVVDIIVWISFRAGIKKASEENYFEFETTGWYILNFVVLLLIIGITVLIIRRKIGLNDNITEIISGYSVKDVQQEVSSTVRKISDSVTKLAEDTLPQDKQKRRTAKYCIMCGAPLKKGSNFCMKCGAEVSDSSEDEENNNGGENDLQ